MAAPIRKLSSAVLNCSVACFTRLRLLAVQNVCVQTARTNAHRASIARINRALYKRMYPVTLVKQDGSTIQIRYHEPRAIVKLPLDLNTLSDEQRKARLTQRKPKQKYVIEDDIEDTFDASQYTKYIR